MSQRAVSTAQSVRGGDGNELETPLAERPPYSRQQVGPEFHDLRPMTEHLRVVWHVAVMGLLALVQLAHVAVGLSRGRCFYECHSFLLILTDPDWRFIVYIV